MLKCQRCCTTMGTPKQVDLGRAEVERSKLDPDLCLDCVEYSCNLHENVRRCEGWARREGSRRRMAESLARKADEYETREVCRQHHRRWAFLWEMTGDRKALRKLIEWRIMPLWDNQLAFLDPEVPEASLLLAMKKSSAA